MATAIVDNRRTQLGGQFGQAAQQLLHRQLGQRMALQRGIEVVHVGLVMFAVVDFHGSRIDVGFQGIEGIRQGWQLVWHRQFLYQWW
ncbi:hypothetical protein D3C72_2331560 [compost metagenome]